MQFFKEFRSFALKPNLLELAIAVIIGAAFAAILSSLVDDVITPLLLNPAMKVAHVTDIDKLTWRTVKYGKFLAAVIKFFTVAFVLFVVVKATHKLSEKEKALAGPSSTDILLAEIRDELKKNNSQAKTGV